MNAGMRIKANKILDWVDAINAHWKRLEGILENDKQFWNEVYHSKTRTHWKDFVDVARELQIQPEFAEYFEQFEDFNNKLDKIEERLKTREPVIIKWQKEYNKPVFKAVMDFKDIINNINQTPTVHFKKTVTPPPSDLKPIKPNVIGHKITAQERKKITQFNNLFEIESTK